MMVYQQSPRVVYFNHGHNEYVQMLAEGGLLLAIPVGLALNTDPFYLESTDPLAFVLALGVFATTGTAAALWPAYQVLRRNPMDALRQP